MITQLRQRQVSKLAILSNRICSALNKGVVRVVVLLNPARLQCRSSYVYSDLNIRRVLLSTRDLACLS